MSEVLLKSLREDYNYFRRTYLKSSLSVNGYMWDYYCSEKRKPVLLLLPGALGLADAFFYHFLQLKKQFTVITLHYAATPHIQDIIDAIQAIKEQEQLTTFSVYGHGFGGLVAQELVVQYPQEIEQMILAHTTINTKYLSEVYRKKRIAQLKRTKTMLAYSPTFIIERFLWLGVKRQLGDISAERTIFWEEYARRKIAEMEQGYTYKRYCSMIDYCENFESPSANLFQQYGIPLLLIDSTSDRIYTDSERKSVQNLYPAASTYSFQDAGHLSVLTHHEQLVTIMRNFYETRVEEIAED